jgi:hypothetical protein
MRSQWASDKRWIGGLIAAVACARRSHAMAQQAPPQEEEDSTEQGPHADGRELRPLTYDEWVRQTRRKAWEDTDWSFQARSYYLGRERYDDSEIEAWAIGGSAGFKTGYFRDRFAFGATLYGSRRCTRPTTRTARCCSSPDRKVMRCWARPMSKRCSAKRRS